MKKVKSKLYMAEKVGNADRRFGSALDYYPIYVELLDGTIVPALFTHHTLVEAIERARVNPEDMGERENFLQRIFNPVEG